MRLTALLEYDTETGELVVSVHDPSQDVDMEVARWPADSDPARGLAARIAEHHRA